MEFQVHAVKGGITDYRTGVERAQVKTQNRPIVTASGCAG